MAQTFREKNFVRLSARRPSHKAWHFASRLRACAGRRALAAGEQGCRQIEQPLVARVALAGVGVDVQSYFGNRSLRCLST
jgi:hypothetical protein